LGKPSFFALNFDQKCCKFVLMYFFRKKDPNRPNNINLKIMHIINATAIIMFLAGIVWKLLQWYVLKK